jgi:hypothetical protein
MPDSEIPNGYERVTGTFEITMNPQPPYDSSGGIALARVTIRKQFHGELDATSVVEMLSASTRIPGSAGYVAIERVTGTLKSKTGSFVLQHSGTMTRGAPRLTVTIVPDSGTGDLTGISGRMTIDIVDGKHLYTLEYGSMV